MSQDVVIPSTLSNPMICYFCQCRVSEVLQRRSLSGRLLYVCRSCAFTHQSTTPGVVLMHANGDRELMMEVFGPDDLIYGLDELLDDFAQELGGS